MQNNDLPGLYRSADQLSFEAQRHFFKVLFLHLSMLIAAAVISVLNSPDWKAAILQAMVLLGALGCAIYLATQRPERNWYGGRAVAESVKTLSWRYVCRAGPFEHITSEARSLLRKKLAAVVDQNREVACALASHVTESQITQSMEMIRESPLEARVQEYKEGRINDQLRWYADKAKSNRRATRIALGCLIGANSIAIIFALAKIKFPGAPYWPTDIFLTLSASLLSWTQAKRFSELASSYGLAAHEINFIRESIEEVTDEPAFSRFVANAENAFSREHTQWVAREDA